MTNTPPEEASPPVAPYPSSTEHLLEELERVADLVRAHVRRAREAALASGKPRIPPLSDAELDELLEARLAVKAPSPVSSAAGEVDPGAGLAIAIAPAPTAEAIAARALESERQGVVLRLLRLARRANLTRFDVDAMLLAVLPEVDLRFGRMYGYLQSDASRVRPSVNLVLALLCPSLEERLAARSRWSSEAPLLRYSLVRAIAPGSQGRPPLLDQVLKLDERVIDYLHGSDEIDKRAVFETRLIKPRVTLADLPLPDDMKGRLRRFIVDAAKVPGPGPIVFIQGHRGAGKGAVAEALCQALGIPLLVADAGTLHAMIDGSIGASARFGVDPLPRAPLRLLAREALLQGAALCWDGVDPWLDETRPAGRAVLFEAITEFPGVTFMTGNTAFEPSSELSGRAYLRVELPRPGQREKEKLWIAALASEAAAGETGAGSERVLEVDPELDIESLAGMFNLSGGQVRAAAIGARELCRFRDPEGGRVEMRDLIDACRRQHGLGQSTLSRKIPARHTWNDLVLPPHLLAILRDICAHVRYRGRVFGTWGFDRKMSLGKGVSALFTGPPGTGKTMAAGVIAAELGLELYHVDVSSVCSKWIGKTEKHLGRLFDDAESGNVVLFFDEADTLFAKRTQVGDARDRHANNVTGYLLQRMDSFQGVVILASNHPKNMDEAFVRRLRFAMDLPLPSEAERLRIWQGAWPQDAPRDADVDLGLLARRFDITGGYIRNITLGAAFQAAVEGRPAAMAHFLRAAHREYVKIGKIVSAELFALPEAGASGAGAKANGIAPPAIAPVKAAVVNGAAG